jgi:hypothetical protein
MILNLSLKNLKIKTIELLSKYSRTTFSILFSYLLKKLSNHPAYDESEVVHDRQVDDDQPLIITKVTSPEMEVTEIILAKVSRLCQLSGNSRGFLSRL